MQLGEYSLAIRLHIVKMDFLEVADLLLGQQGGVGVLPGIHLVVHKEGVEQAAFIVVGIEAHHRIPTVGPRGPPAATALPAAEVLHRCRAMLESRFSFISG